jgi:glycosyltransferase involved in cell wall biosynthesis
VLKRPLRILFVAPASLHTVRWMRQLATPDFDLHLFPSDSYPLHRELADVTVHNPVFRRRPFDLRDVAWAGLMVEDQPPPDWWESRFVTRSFDPSVVQRGLWWPFRTGPGKVESALAKRFPALSRGARLASTVRRLKPDIVHSLESMTGGYATLAARAEYGEGFPPWIVSNWGCDLHLFARLAAHEGRMRELLARCDYYDAECERDLALAREFGFTGATLPVHPNAGTFDLAKIAQWRQEGPSSSRRLILIKGYQDWHGRALVALRALETIAPLLAGYRIAVFLPAPAVQVAAELLSRRSGISIEMVPFSSHEAIMRLHGQARLSIGISITDGIPTSLAEALAMGSFPIQSDTSCANEWITHGETGLIVPGEDPQAVAEAIALALNDDALIDRASELNAATARERLDASRVEPMIRDIYRDIATGRLKPPALPA